MNQWLSKNGRRAAYNHLIEDLRRTNPKEPLLEIRAWFGVAQTRIVLFLRSAGIPCFAVFIVAVLIGLLFAAVYWSLTGAVLDWPQNKRLGDL